MVVFVKYGGGQGEGGGKCWLGLEARRGRRLVVGEVGGLVGRRLGGGSKAGPSSGLHRARNPSEATRAHILTPTNLLQLNIAASFHNF